MKTETCKLYSRDFEYFCQISSKSIHIISSYTVSKLGPFLRHSVHCPLYTLHGSPNLTHITSSQSLFYCHHLSLPASAFCFRLKTHLYHISIPQSFRFHFHLNCHHGFLTQTRNIGYWCQLQFCLIFFLLLITSCYIVSYLSCQMSC